MTRRPSASPASPHGNRTGGRRSGARPRARLLVVPDASALPEALVKGSGLSAATIRRLRPHRNSNKYADPRTGQVYSARLSPIGTVGPDGYVRVGNQRGQEQYAHRIVYEAVNGPIPSGLQIDHKDGVRSNNGIRNLQAVTQAQNNMLAIRRGNTPRGQDKVGAVLTDDLVRRIRATPDRAARQWAREIGCDPSTVRDARAGLTWRHIKPCPRLRTNRRTRRRKTTRP